MMKRILAVLLTLTLVLCQASVCTYAASDSVWKEEVVYVNLNGDGSVGDIQVVNMFSGQKNIIDYGDYSSVKNLTSTEPIEKKGERIHIATKEEQLYYQGNLSSREIPWKITIRYFIDGKRMEAEELAGKSGKFQMKIDFHKNENIDESFWKGYAIQASLSLDSVKFREIRAEGATVANEGAAKKISYIILPGKETSVEIMADASDISLEAMSINAVKMNIDMDFDTTELTGKVAELKKSVDALDLGSEKLDRKAGALRDGAEEIAGGSKKLEQGVKKLSRGADVLAEGAFEMNDAFTASEKASGTLLKGAKKYMTGLTKFKKQVSQIEIDTENVTKLVSSSQEIGAGISALETALKELDGNLTDYDANMKESMEDMGITGTSDLAEKNRTAAEVLAGTNPELATLLMADAAYIEGSSAAIQEAESAASQLAEQTAALSQSYALFDESIALLAEAVSTMAEDLGELKTATATLSSEYKKVNNGIKSYASGIEKISKGYEDIYDGILTVSKGADDLLTGTSDMTDGTKEMYEGAIALVKGTGKLSDGTGIFKKETGNLDQDVKEEIQDTIDQKTGKKQPVKSFVSDKNDKVSSVMFVMKTPAVEKEKAEQKEEKAEEKKSFFRKFLDLFKKKEK